MTNLWFVWPFQEMNFEKEERAHTHDIIYGEEKWQRGDWGSGTVCICPNFSSWPDETMNQTCCGLATSHSQLWGNFTAQDSTWPTCRKGACHSRATYRGGATSVCGPCKGRNYTREASLNAMNLSPSAEVVRAWDLFCIVTETSSSWGKHLPATLCSYKLPKETFGVIYCSGMTWKGEILDRLCLLKMTFSGRMAISHLSNGCSKGWMVA